MKAVPSIDKENVRKFAQENIKQGQTLNTDAFRALNVLSERHHHVAKVTPAELVDEWLHTVGSYRDQQL